MSAKDDAEYVVDTIQRLRAQRDELLAALGRISKQSLSSELSDDVRDDADYEGAYDALIGEARAALSKAKEQP
jgi:hypothetical protein